jgi:AraC family ethanolamine operon transcriptional activator
LAAVRNKKKSQGRRAMTELQVAKLRIEGVEEVRRLLDAGRGSCIPLRSGIAEGTLFHASVGDVFLSTGYLSADIRGQIGLESLAKNHIFLDMKLDSDSELYSFRSGKHVLAGEVYTLTRGDVCDYRETGRMRFANVALSTELLLEQGGADVQVGHVGFWERRRWSHAPSEIRASIVRAVESIVSHVTLSEQMIVGAALRQLQSDLLEPFLWAILSHEAESERASLSSATIVRKVEDWIEGQPPETMHIADLCRALRLPRRTLQRAFTETISMGPVRYLTVKRLAAVRSELRRSDPAATTVTDIATKFGFWELGRFARDYGRVFGEKPSETLGKAEATAGA